MNNPVRSSWKNPELAEKQLSNVNKIVKAEFFEGKKLTVERIIGLLLTPAIFAFDPVGEGYEVLLQLCDIKVLEEHKDVPEEDWPLHVTKPTHGPITIHCRPERTSRLGALIKLCPLLDIFNAEDNFRVLRAQVGSINARLTSLNDRYEEDLREAVLITVNTQPAQSAQAA